MSVNIGLNERVVFPEPDDPKMIVCRQRSSIPNVTWRSGVPSVIVRCP
jgi:hypothetical protein